MKVGDPTHPRILSIMWTECSFLNSMNLYLVVVGMTGLFLNIFPWIVCYSKLRAQNHRSSRDVLLISLVLVDVLTVCVPLPVYLSKHYNCPRNQRTSFVGRPTICEIFHLMFVWLKLACCTVYHNNVELHFIPRYNREGNLSQHRRQDFFVFSVL